MPISSPLCPPTSVLEQFLLGELDDTASQVLETHVAECRECGKQASTIRADDEVVAAIRTLGRSAEPSITSSLSTVPEELVGLLVPHYKRIATMLDVTVAPVANSSLAETSTSQHGTVPIVANSLHRLGPYEIRGVLGSGGMGTVLHAFDPLLKRSVGIKVIHAMYLAEPEMQDRLVREAQAAAAVEHENIVSIYAVETHNGAPCIIMPLLRGMTLKQRLDEQDGPLPVAMILRLGHEITLGLAAAHSNGLIHRDIKPANIWLEEPQDRVKLLDFGLAIVSGDESARFEGVSGTPGYLAPEQARGLPLDQRTDIFSLGCVLYRIATGRLPFTGEKNMRILWTVLSDPPPAAIQLNPALPKELSDLISRMLARDPEERPASCALVLEAIEAVERRLAKQNGIRIRRRWIAAVMIVAILSGSGVGVWMEMNAVPMVKPVKTTISGDEPGIAVILRHQATEQTITLGREKTLDLPPGDYSIRLATEQSGRSLVPDRFTVTEEKPESVRIALVGEVASHSTHTQPVTSVAVIPDVNGPMVYSVGLDRLLCAWDPSTAKSPRFVDLPHAARCVSVSPNGAEVATGGGNKQRPVELAIRIWETRGLTLHGEPLTGHSRMVLALAYSPMGNQLASASAEGIFLWDLNTGESQALPFDEPSAVVALAYSKDGERLLCGNEEGEVLLWDLNSKTILQTQTASATSVRTVAFLGDRIVAAGDDGTIGIWNDGKLQQELLGHSKPVLTLAVDAVGRQIVSGDAAGSIRVWSVVTGETVHAFQGDSQAVHSLRYVDASRQAVSGGADGSIRLWQLPFSD